MKKVIALFLSVILLTALFSACNKKTDDTVTESTTFEPQTLEIESTYNEDNRTMKTVYRGPDGEISSISVITYNDKNQVEKESVYDGDEKLKSMVTYKYDKNSNVIEQSVYNSESKLEYMYKDYEYKKVKTENGDVFLKIKHNEYDNTGKVVKIFKWEYDENFNCTSMATYSQDGKEITRNDF